MRSNLNCVFLPSRFAKASVLAESDFVTTAVSEKCHTFLVDEPKQLGGNGQAASPLGHFLGGLIGCTQITLHTIAEKQQVWLNPGSPLQHATKVSL